MPYEFYKILHFFSLFLTLSSLIALAAAQWAPVDVPASLRKYCMISHGVGLLLVLVSGFGLAARLGYVSNLPTWIFYKLAVWFLVGASLSLVKRLNKYSKAWFALTLVLFTVAAIIAVSKPGL